MKIEFVNHASFIIEHNGIRILNDPWLIGSAFNDGWDLLVPTVFDFENAPANINYIWYSHEHPDHFSPVVLKKIPEHHRKNITILYQQTKDKKVIEFCRGLGYKILELEDNRETELVPGFTVICNKVPFFDSWIMYNCNGYKILNANDCVVDGDGKAEDIRKITGKVDVLLTQFGYAAWKGNPDEKKLREIAAASKLEIVKEQINVFEPTFTIPFASFIYFSHEENAYMNDSINKPQQAVQAIAAANSKAVLMFPGDVWEMPNEWMGNNLSLQKYNSYYDNLPAASRRTSASVPIEKLQEQATKYYERISSKNSMALVKMAAALPAINFFKPFTIYLHDINTTVSYSLLKGLQAVPSTSNKHMVKMHSDSLNFIYKFDWGYETLTVNGRFECTPEGFNLMSKNLGIGPLNNMGKYVKPSLFLDYKTILYFFQSLSKLVTKLKKKT